MSLPSPRPLEHLDQILAADPVVLRLADMVDNDRASFAPRLAATALLFRFEVEQLAGFQRGLGLSFS
jgi:hypothetical protein